MGIIFQIWFFPLLLFSTVNGELSFCAPFWHRQKFLIIIPESSAKITLVARTRPLAETIWKAFVASNWYLSGSAEKAYWNLDEISSYVQSCRSSPAAEESCSLFRQHWKAFWAIWPSISQQCSEPSPIFVSQVSRWHRDVMTSRRDISLQLRLSWHRGQGSKLNYRWQSATRQHLS